MHLKGEFLGHESSKERLIKQNKHNQYLYFNIIVLLLQMQISQSSSNSIRIGSVHSSLGSRTEIGEVSLSSFFDKGPNYSY